MAEPAPSPRQPPRGPRAPQRRRAQPPRRRRSLMAERKKRHRRGEPLPTRATIVVRGDLLDPDTLRGSAVENEEIYGFFGISVFAEVGGTTWEEISGTKLASADWLVLFTGESPIPAGLELWETGQDPPSAILHEKSDKT